MGQHTEGKYFVDGTKKHRHIQWRCLKLSLVRNFVTTPSSEYITSGDNAFIKSLYVILEQ